MISCLSCLAAVTRFDCGSNSYFCIIKYAFRGVFRTAATSKMQHFVIIVNGWKSLTIITKNSILNVAAVLDPPLFTENYFNAHVAWLNKLKNPWKFFLYFLFQFMTVIFIFTSSP